MYSNIGVQRYREADINSMTQEKMIILLYERIETDLQGATAALESNDLVEMTRLVNHSQRIVCELRGALDHEIGGDISRNLESLYDYMFHEHLDVIIDRDPVHLDNCLRVLQPLLDSWRRIPAGTGAQAARDHSRGALQRQPVGTESGPETASDTSEETKAEPAVPEKSPGTQAESLGTISLSV